MRSTPMASGFTNLHSFTATSGFDNSGTNSDGALPQAELILSGNTLYGVADVGGAAVAGSIAGGGTVFKINTDGTGF